MSGGSNSTTKNRIKDHYPYSEPHMIKAQYNCFIEFPAISSVVDEAKAGPPGEFILKVDRTYFNEDFKTLLIVSYIELDAIVQIEREIRR